MIDIDNISLSEYLDYWLKIVSPNLQFTTVYGYKNIIEKHIKPLIGELSLKNITVFDLHNYYSFKISQGLSSNTVRKHHDLLKTVFNFAVFEGVFDVNILNRVIAPRKKQANISFYDLDNLKILLSCASGHHLELVILLGSLLGLRRGEICGLTWDCVDFVNHTITINKSMVSGGNTIKLKEPKNKNSIRRLFLSLQIENLLSLEYNRQISLKNVNSDFNVKNFVIINKFGVPHHPNYLSYEFSKFIKENDLPYLTLHGLRHTFATVANQAGVTLFDISKALGHSTPAVTGRIYTHITKQTLKTAVSAVSDLFDKDI